MIKPKFLAILFVILVVPIGFTIANSHEKTISLYDLGLLQLAAHDFFNVDREAEVDNENGKLDLSTLLDFGEENIILGGEPRNRENIMIFSVASKYADLYWSYVDAGYTKSEARALLISYYHADLQNSYENAFGETLPTPKKGTATVTENLALRTIHDFLPGKVYINGTQVNTLDHALAGKILTDDELKQQSGKLDGFFDEEFLNITIFIPPNTIFTIDLFERDSSFGDQFNTLHSFEYFMLELHDNSYDSGEIVMYHIRELFAKGLYLEKEEDEEQSKKQQNNPENILRISRLHYNEQARAGEEFTLHVNIDNIAKKDLDDIRATLLIPELGVRSPATKINLDENDQHTINLVLELPRSAHLGWYTAKVVLDLDGVRRIVHRDIEVI